MPVTKPGQLPISHPVLPPLPLIFTSLVEHTRALNPPEHKPPPNRCPASHPHTALAHRSVEQQRKLIAWIGEDLDLEELLDHVNGIGEVAGERAIVLRVHGMAGAS